MKFIVEINDKCIDRYITACHDVALGEAPPQIINKILVDAFEAIGIDEWDMNIGIVQVINEPCRRYISPVDGYYCMPLRTHVTRQACNVCGRPEKCL